MVELETEVLKIAEIEAQYPNQWIILGNPVFDGMDVLEGVVISHHADKRISSMEGGERRCTFSKSNFILCWKTATAETNWSFADY